MVLDGKNIVLRLVEELDVGFIMQLRLDEEKSRFLSKISNDINQQIRWIADYKLRESRGEEYYFIIQSREGDGLGTVRVYDFKGDSFSWGSWVIKSGSPTYTAIESALLIYEFGFVCKQYSNCHFEVIKENMKVISFHLKFGAKIISEDAEKYYFNINRMSYDNAKSKYIKFLK